MRFISCALLAIVLLSSQCFAWSTKEHMLLTRLAVHELLDDPKTPQAMKDWLKAAMPNLGDMESEKQFLLNARVGMYPRGAEGLAFWAVVPDMNALTDYPGDSGKKIEPFGIPERSLHFIDLEYFFPDDKNRNYADDLSHKPALADFPRNMADPRWKRAGMLPFRIEQCYKKMVEDLGKGLLVDKPGQFPRDEHAQCWAGMLAHYTEDNTQPQHATADYKSQTYFKDKLRGPNVHSDVEYKLLDDDAEDFRPLREEFTAFFMHLLPIQTDPVAIDDLWTNSLQISLFSYDALPLIGHAAAAAYTHEGQEWKFDADKFYHFKGTYHGAEMTVMQMKAAQMTWAVKRVERVWRKAWDEAHPPDKAR